MSRATSPLEAAVMLASMLALAACKEDTQPPQPAPSASSPSANAGIRKDLYTVRGLVVALPVEGDPTSAFQVRHEAMPNFVGQNGELGMDTMTMDFPLAAAITLDGLAVGDIIELAFEVDVNASTGQLEGYRATGFTKLPAETELNFAPLKR